MKFRDLKESDIDVRIASVKQEGVSLLLYKDARCDMNILDETVGSENWQRKHYECKGNLFCSVGIRCESKVNGVEWIWKDDCGSESYTEKEKGESSDSFKRACFNWGIGRELYTAPFIWINEKDCNIKNNKCYDRFSVKHIEIKNKKIVGLEIYNEKLKKIVFKMNDSPATVSQSKINDSLTTVSQPTVTCPKCGKVITEMTGARGSKWQPQQILKKYGMCKECYRAGCKK